jgi:flagellar basal-body rod protein FlgB
MAREGLISTIASGWLKRGLDVSELRQRTSASNLANVSTAGYRAQRVEFESALRGAESTLAATRTDPRHLSTRGSDAAARIVDDESTASANGVNNVDIENELAVLGWNRIRMQALTRFTSNQIGILRDAIGRRG